MIVQGGSDLTFLSARNSDKNATEKILTVILTIVLV